METTLTLQTAKAHSGKALWTGRIVSVLCILFLLLDSIMKIVLNRY